jgi:hypothetical protein
VARARARADPRSGIQRLVSYLVRSTPSGKVRVATRFTFTQLFQAVKNGVPPPTRTHLHLHLHLTDIIDSCERHPLEGTGVKICESKKRDKH